MKHQIDCLLIAYSGWNKSDIFYKRLVRKDSRMLNISNPLSAAITYLGTSLDESGYTFEFVNSVEDEADRLVYLLQTYEIGSVGISTTFAPYEFEEGSKQLIELIALIRGINDKPPIILGGAYIMNYVRLLEERGAEIMQSSLNALNADFIVDSPYGEEKLVAIISRLRAGSPVHNIPNLYINEEGQFARTEKKKETYILREKKINWQLFKGRAGNTVSIRTSVSCFNKCKFCTFPILAGKYNNVDVVHIECELNKIHELGEVDLILFVDDTFNIPTDRFKEMLRMMVKNRYSFKWYAMIRCQTLDIESVKLMNESGCVGVLLGIESGSDTILKAMNKQVNVEQYRKGIKLLKDYGITTLASFFIGFPGETQETAKETYHFIEETKPDFYFLNTWFYDSRAPIHDEKEHYDLKGAELNWSHKYMDSKTAIQTMLEMRRSIKNSIWLEEICDTLLFQMLAELGAPIVKKICGETSSEIQEMMEFFQS